MSTTVPFRSHAQDILDALGRRPRDVAIVHPGRCLTAGELRDLAYRMARVFLARGLGPGSTVTLLSGNLPEAIAVRYAANLIGCAFCHLPNNMTADVHAAMVTDLDTRVLVVDPHFARHAGGSARCAAPADVLLLGPIARGDDPGPDGEDLVELARRQPGGAVPGTARPGDPCSIRHTGGTTGHPKAVWSTFAQMNSFRSQVQAAKKPEQRQLVCTTLALAAGHLADHTLSGNGTVWLQPDFAPATVLETIQREQITHLFLPPPLLYRLLDHPDLDRRDTDSLVTILYGACQPSPARVAEAVRRLGPVLCQIYGQNEAGGAITMLTPADHDLARPERLRSAGRPLPGVTVAVHDFSGCDLPTGEVGEICVRSTSVMQGYWKRPELTAEVLRDGWLRTGDLGRLDDDGYLTITGRTKDLINLFDGHVYPAELEDLLDAHPDVSHSAVFGAPDPDWTERVHAVVVPAPGHTVDPDELRAYVRAERGALHVPTHISTVAHLPLTEAGKPDRAALLRDHTRIGRLVTCTGTEQTAEQRETVALRPGPADPGPPRTGM